MELPPKTSSHLQLSLPSVVEMHGGLRYGMIHVMQKEIRSSKVKCFYEARVCTNPCLQNTIVIVSNMLGQAITASCVFQKRHLPQIMIFFSKILYQNCMFIPNILSIIVVPILITCYNVYTLGVKQIIMYLIIHQ